MWTQFCEVHDMHDLKSRNRLLEGLQRECPALSKALLHGTEVAGTELYREGQPTQNFLFPMRGVASIVVPLGSGEVANVQTVGNEGMLGLPAWLGTHISPYTVVQQSTGDLIRVPVEEFKRAVQRSEYARSLLSRYAAYSIRFNAQTCACNTYHCVEQRVCRWLLFCADSTGSREITVTQAALAKMVGLKRRQSVVEFLVALQRTGTIAQARNRIELLDIARLEHQSCECYRKMKAAYAQLVEPLL